MGSTLANGTLRLLFTGKENQFAGTQPAGSDLQAFVVEFIITFYLMFVISGVATDNRAVSSPSWILITFNLSLDQICVHQLLSFIPSLPATVTLSWFVLRAIHNTYVYSHMYKFIRFILQSKIKGWSMFPFVIYYLYTVVGTVLNNTS